MKRTSESHPTHRRGRSSGNIDDEADMPPTVGGMPVMPGLSITSIVDVVGKERNDEDQDKKDEQKMAEIIVKMQLAKQKAADNKKRKLHEERTHEAYSAFVKENLAKIEATKRQRLNAKKNDITKRTFDALKTVRAEIEKHTDSRSRLAEDVNEITEQLKGILNTLDNNLGEVRKNTQSDYMAAKAEVDAKIEELERTINLISAGAEKEDKISALLQGFASTFVE